MVLDDATTAYTKSAPACSAPSIGVTIRTPPSMYQSGPIFTGGNTNGNEDDASAPCSRSTVTGKLFLRALCEFRPQLRLFVPHARHARQRALDWVRLVKRRIL